MLAITKLTFADRIVMSALPLKADMCAAKSDVGFTPNSHRESGFPATGMSALPPKADMCSATGRCPLCANSGHRGVTRSARQRSAECAEAL